MSAVGQPSETVVSTGIRPKSANSNPAPSLSGLGKDLVSSTDQAVKDTGTLENSLAKITGDFHEQLQILKSQAPKPPEDKPFQAPEQVNPISGFGSTAGLLAGIASLFSRAPLTASLNAMSSGMKAIQDGNAVAYQRSFDEWKANSDHAFKQFEAEGTAYDRLLNLAKTDYDGAINGVKQLAAMTNDKAMLIANEMKGIEGVEQLYLERTRLNEEMKSNYLKIQVPNEIFKKSIDEFTKANKRPPNSQEMGNLLSQAQMSSFYGGITPDQRTALAAQAATGMPITQIVPGYGKEAIAMRNQLRNDAISQIMQQNPGMTAAQAGVELANRSISYGAGKQSVGQLTKMEGATRQAVYQLDYNIEKAKQEMKKLPSSNLLPVINAIQRGEESWTGNPVYSSLFYYMHAVATESARILSGGQASVAQLHEGARAEAEKWANINMTPDSFDSVAKAMHGEGEYRVQSYQDAIQAQMAPGGFHSSQPGQPVAGQTGDYSALWGGTP